MFKSLLDNSRVANSKYVQTNYGTYLLKFFFSESLSTDSGETVSTREVKTILASAIEAEDKQKPLTDDELTELLKGRGLSRWSVGVGYNSFRNRATGMASCSRYLATVRRAML